MTQPVDQFGLLNNTIKVSSGHYFDILNPQPDMVDIDSIANALSKTCRYGGHCPEFYSVAEHSYLAAMEAANDGHENQIIIAILLHDAAEAYVGDCVKPLKVLLPEFSRIEQAIEKAIGIRFRVNFERFAPIIKRYDRLMLKSEKCFMWPEDSEKWSGFGEIENRHIELKFWNHYTAKGMFLSLARHLGISS